MRECEMVGAWAPPQGVKIEKLEVRNTEVEVIGFSYQLPMTGGKWEIEIDLGVFAIFGGSEPRVLD